MALRIPPTLPMSQLGLSHVNETSKFHRRLALVTISLLGDDADHSWLVTLYDPFVARTIEVVGKHDAISNAREMAYEKMSALVETATD